MKSVDTIARVRRAFHVQGWSLKRICRELHVSRNTVRKILRSNETSFSYERERQPKPPNCLTRWVHLITSTEDRGRHSANLCRNLRQMF
jgi:orotate phosphoribosyltransferase-like protein